MTLPQIPFGGGHKIEKMRTESPRRNRVAHNIPYMNTRKMTFPGGFADEAFATYVTQERILLQAKDLKLKDNTTNQSPGKQSEKNQVA